jgi:hypothetical protein
MNFYFAAIAFGFFLATSEMIDSYLLFVVTKDRKYLVYANRSAFGAAITFAAIIGKILYVI